MTHYDVCNGDADGLCALQQRRLAHALEGVLVTGRKREIALLDRVAAGAGDTITVLDVSLASNRVALLRLLDAGAAVEYVDHHHAGDVPVHPLLTVHLDPRADTCTSLIVDKQLRGAYRPWALVGAYGDGLVAAADRIAATVGLDAATRHALRALGEDLNYNAYGDSDADLIAHPAQVHALLRGQRNPLGLADDGTLERIRHSRMDDLARGRAVPIDNVGDRALVCLLPAAPWSRRVRGVLANELAQRHRGRGCALLTPDAQGNFVVSVRAPLSAPRGADTLCLRFPTGGGRAAAAGIDRLPREALDAFLAALASAFA